MLIMACRVDVDSGACESEVTYDLWASSFIRSKCQPCHASEAPDRFGAPITVFLMTNGP